MRYYELVLGGVAEGSGDVPRIDSHRGAHSADGDRRLLASLRNGWQQFVQGCALLVRLSSERGALLPRQRSFPSTEAARAMLGVDRLSDAHKVHAGSVRPYSNRAQRRAWSRWRKTAKGSAFVFRTETGPAVPKDWYARHKPCVVTSDGLTITIPGAR